MQLTGKQLRQIILEELSEMKRGITFHKDPMTGDWVESGLEDFPGAGAAAARKMREPTMLRRPKLTDPDLGSRFDKMMANLDLDEPEEYEEE